MQSKTSCFSPAVFRKNILRFWPVWGVYLAAWILILPVTIGNTEYFDQMDVHILDMAVHTGAILVFIFACFSAMAVFSFLYSSKSACMMAALPLRREGLYLTSLLSGLTWLLAVPLVTFLISLGVSAAKGAALGGALAGWLGILCLETLLFYGFACLCATLTGHLVVLPLVYGVLNFTAVALEIMFKDMVRLFVYGASAGGDLRLTPLSPLLRLLGSGGAYHGEGEVLCFTDWGILAAYGAAGLLFALAGLLLFRRRQMETASDVVAVPWLKPVFKYCLAGGCALGLGLLLYTLLFAGSFVWVSSPGLLLLCMILAAFVGYFAAEMLIRKSFRVFGQTWKGFVILSFLLAALVLCAETDLVGYERHLPTADQVKEAYVTVDGSHVELEDEASVAQVLALHKSIVEQKKESEAALQDWDGQDAVYVLQCQIQYELTSGGYMTRSYDLPYVDGDMDSPGSIPAQLSELLNCREALRDRKHLELPVTEETVSYAWVAWYDPETGDHTELELTREEAVELYHQCLLPDLEDGGLGRIWLAPDASYYENVYDLSIHIELSQALPDTEKDGQIEYIYDDFYTYPTLNSHRTNAWLEAKGIELVLQKDIIEK